MNIDKNKKDKLTMLSKGLLNRLSKDTSTMSQSRLYLDFVDDKLSLNEYFNKQIEIEKPFLKDSVEIDWGQLRKQNLREYNHEKSHADVWSKYKVSSKLYRSQRGEPFVIDTDFKSISENNHYDKEKVISILKEMLLAPYLIAKDSLFRCSVDLLFFEILDKKITLLDIKTFEDAFSKYFI